MSKIKFIKNFIMKPAATGAICPTGVPLAKEIIKNICGNNDNSLSIAEIGPGTGAVTSLILKTLKERDHFFAIELNTEFYTHIKELYPDITIYNDTAERLPEILKKEKCQKLDGIISGLPWASFPSKLQISLLNAITGTLKSGGHFSTFAYLQGLYLPAGIKFKKLLGQYFSEIKISKTVWANIPPAIVYHCKK